MLNFPGKIPAVAMPAIAGPGFVKVTYTSVDFKCRLAINVERSNYGHGLNRHQKNKLWAGKKLVLFLAKYFG